MARDIVLVHGMSHGAWCWELLEPPLRRAGRRVLAVDLPGHGRRAHERGRASVAGYAQAVADFDGDGRLDLFVVNIGTRAEDPGVSHLYLNRTPQAGNWLAVKPVGTRSNRDGIGTRIEVRAGGVTRVGVMGARQGHVSHSVVPVHFGLGAATQAEVTVRWPAGAVQTYKDVPVNQLLTVVEP